MQKKHFFRELSLVSLLFLAILFLLGGCGGSSSGVSSEKVDIENPQSGDAIFLHVVEISETEGKGAEEEKVLEEITYIAKEIEPENASQDALFAFFYDTTETLDKSTGKMVARNVENEDFTQEEVQTFLRDNWDSFVNGVPDEGWDGRQFVKFLRDNDMTYDTFLELWGESGMNDLGEYLETLRLIGASLASEEGENAIEDFNDFLNFIGVSLGECVTAAKKSFGDMDSFLDWIRLSDDGLWSLTHSYASWYASGTSSGNSSLDSFFAELQGSSDKTMYSSSVSAKKVDPVKAGELAVKAAELGLNVVKFGWEFIKANETQVHATGAFTYAYLSGTNFADYYGAKDSKTKSYELKLLSGKVGIFFGPRITLGELRYRGRATYDSKHNTKGGHYLPNVEFEVEECWCTWPNQFDANVSVSHITNMASTPETEDMDPRMDMVVNCKMGNVIKKIGKSTRFRAEGISGIAYSD